MNHSNYSNLGHQSGIPKAYTRLQLPERFQVSTRNPVPNIYSSTKGQLSSKQQQLPSGGESLTSCWAQKCSLCRNVKAWVLYRTVEAWLLYRAVEAWLLYRTVEALLLYRTVEAWLLYRTVEAWILYRTVEAWLLYRTVEAWLLYHTVEA